MSHHLLFRSAITEHFHTVVTTTQRGWTWPQKENINWARAARAAKIPMCSQITIEFRLFRASSSRHLKFLYVANTTSYTNKIDVVDCQSLPQRTNINTLIRCNHYRLPIVLAVIAFSLTASIFYFSVCACSGELNKRSHLVHAIRLQRKLNSSIISTTSPLIC